jgi:hypothetical protein
LKDYTIDDKDGKLNPYSTKEKLSNVLRKTDKTVQDDGNYDVKYNADDRLYKDLEDGEYDAKHAAKILKKRQDNEEKEFLDIKDKVENLTREQRERLVREYVRKKIVKVILEQDDAKKKDTPDDDITSAPAPTDTPTAPTDTAPTTTDIPPAPTDTPPVAPAASPAPNTSTPTNTATTDTATKDAESQVSPETKEALDMDRFVQYLKKQESVLGKLKKTLLAVNLSLKDVEPEDKASFYKMLKLAAIKQLDMPTPKTK